MRTQSLLSKGGTTIACFGQRFKACQVGKPCSEKKRSQVSLLLEIFGTETLIQAN